MAWTVNNVLNTDYTLATVVTSANNGTIVGNKPSAAAAGKLMLFIVRSYNTSSSLTVTPPAGVVSTPIVTNVGGTGSGKIQTAVYYRLCDGSEASTYTFTFNNQTTEDDTLEIRVIGGHDPVTPIGNVATFINTATQNFSTNTFATAAPNSLVFAIIGVQNGNRLVAANTNYPSGTTNLLCDKTRALSVGVVHGTVYQEIAVAGTTTPAFAWTGFLGASATGSTVAFEIRSAAAGILSVNGGAGVKAGSTGNTLVTTAGFTPTSGNIGGLAISNVAGTNPNFTFDVPGYVDGDVRPGFGSQTITISDGSQSPTTTVTYLPAGNYDYVPLAGTLNSTIAGVNYNSNPVMVLTDEIAFDQTITKIYPDASGYTSKNGTQTLWHWKASTGVIRSFPLTTGDAPASGSRRGRICFGIGVGVSL